MEQKVKVSFYLKKYETKEDGRCPVIARLRVGGSEVKFSAKMTVPAKSWASGRAAGKSLAAAEINLQLDKIRASAAAHYRELAAVRENVTAREVKVLMLGMASEQETLLAYFHRHNENFDRRVGITRSPKAAYAYRHAAGHLEKFLRSRYLLSDVPFSALDKSFIENFDLHLRVEGGLMPGTIIEIMTRLRIIVNYAIGEGIITRYPFGDYAPERPVPQQKYLTRGELDRLMTAPLTCPNHFLVRDLFLFSCYTGICYSDMRKLTGEDITVAGDGVVWIKNKRRKTGTECDIPLMELPLQILERYRGIADSGRLLPMYSNSRINDRLKELAEVCGIDRRLTFHVARHNVFSFEVEMN